MAIGEGHQAGIEEGSPLRNRPDDFADIVFRHARGQLPVTRTRGLAAVAAELPVGVPVIDRVEPDAKPQRFTGNHRRGLGNKFNLNLLGAVHLSIEAKAGKAQRERGSQPGGEFWHGVNSGLLAQIATARFYAIRTRNLWQSVTDAPLKIEEIRSVAGD